MWTIKSSISTKMVCKLKNSHHLPSCCQSAHICSPVQNISNFKLVFLVGIGNFCSASYLNKQFLSQDYKQKKVENESEFCDSGPELGKFEISNILCHTNTKDQLNLTYSEFAAIHPKFPVVCTCTEM